MFLDWFVYPTVLALASTGHGLLIRRIIGGPGALLIVPVGFAAMLIWVTMAMRAGLHGSVWLAVVVPALAGFVLHLPRARDGWAARSRARDGVVPGGLALATFAAYAAPVVLSGDSTITGYTMITDIAHHLELSAFLSANGPTPTDAVTSSHLQVANGLLYSNYPLGFASLLAGTSQLFGRELAWMYQPTVAFGGPVAALAAYALCGRLELSRGLRAVAAFVTAQASLLYAYSLQGGFKELYGYAFVLLLAATLTAPRSGLAVRLGTGALAAAAGYLVFGLTIAPWMAAVVGVWVLTEGATALRRGGWPPRWLLRPVALAAAAALVLVAVLGLRYALDVEVPGIVTAQNDLGNLAEPLPPWTSSGVWATGDYRVPLTVNEALNYTLIGIVLLMALVGVIHLARRRLTPLIAMVLAVAATMALLVPITGPWLDAKAFAINGGLVLIAAFAGVAALRAIVGLWAWIPAVAIAGAVLYGNALAYHNTTLAPVDRFKELEAIGHDFAGQGPAMAPAFDEYAEYFLREIDASGRVDPLNGVFPAEELMGVDINQVDHAFVQQFNLLVLRRGADRTRPPANFELARTTANYEVWRKARASETVRLHVPLPIDPGERTRAFCRTLTEQISKAGGPGSLVWATAPAPQPVYPATLSRTSAWLGDLGRGAVVTLGAGKVEGNPVLRRSGTYTVWVTGSFQRPVTFEVDGREIGEIGYQADYPGEQHLVGTVYLEAGPHQLTIRAGGGSLAPADGSATRNRYVGAVYFQLPSTRGRELVPTKRSAAMATCRTKRPFSWVEIVAR